MARASVVESAPAANKVLASLLDPVPPGLGGDREAIRAGVFGMGWP